MASRIGIAVFGMGRMGLEHIQNIMASPRTSLRWVVRNRLEEARSFTAAYNLDTRCATPDNIQDVLNDSSVDAVLIVSPTDTHEPFLKASLEAGKAVFCEKPVTPDIAGTRAAYDLAEKYKQPLFCAFHRRFDPSLVKVKQTVQSGAMGPLRIMKSTSRDMGPPPLEYVKHSGGIFADSTIHDLDCCTWMAGSRPKTVFAGGQAFDPEIGACGDRDQVVVMVTYENGAIAVIDNGRLAPYGYDQRAELLCDKGMLSVDNKHTTTVTSHDAVSTSGPRVEPTFMARYHDAYREELDHFIDVLQGRADLAVTRKDTLTAMNLVKACQESARLQKTVQYVE